MANAGPCSIRWHLSPVSCPTPTVSRLLSPIFCLLSHISHLMSPVSCPLSPVSRPLSPVSRLLCCKCCKFNWFRFNGFGGLFTLSALKQIFKQTCTLYSNVADFDFSVSPFSWAKFELAISIFHPQNFQLVVRLVPNWPNYAFIQ